MLNILEKSSKNDILDMCKKSEKSESIKFIELGRDQFEGNTYILNKYFRNAQGQECFYANLLSFAPFKDTLSLADIKKALRRDFGKSISLAGYRYNPEHYMFKSQVFQDEYEEDLFKDKSDEDERLEFEASRRARIEELDFEALDSLSTVLFKALKSRLVMILNIEDIPLIINNAIECYNLGINCGPSNALMREKINELHNMLAGIPYLYNKEHSYLGKCTKEQMRTAFWLMYTKPTDMSFEKSDYIETYQRVLRALTANRDSSLEDMRELIHNPEDLWEEDILKNEYLETESYYENTTDDDEEE